jgi:phosphoribosylanthranilate isomerase
MKLVKAAALIAIGIKLLSLFGRDVHEWASDFIARHGIDSANKLVHSALTKLEGVGNKQIVTFSSIAFAYAALLAIEGVGLWLQKRWAEYFTAIATGLFIPLELYELYERFTFVRIGILGLNLFIVWYLVTRLRDEKKEAAEATYVKICGITNLQDAKRAVRAGADAIGFNFYTKSPRFILPARAATISDVLRRKITKVGVFVDSSAAEIKEIVDQVGLDAVQLHGDETEADISVIRKALPEHVQIIKAIRVRDGEVAPDLETFADAILLDSYSDKEQGGTGNSFDWHTAKDCADSGACIYLAGGLGPDNVAHAIRQAQPFAVDACSKLERTAGIKDRRKVLAFVKAAKEVR